MNKTEFRNLYLPTRFIDVTNFTQIEKEFDEDLDSLILSILDKCATKIEEKTYTENREEDNLVEHIVNEIRKFA